jgi:hypothetical protein
MAREGFKCVVVNVIFGVCGVIVICSYVLQVSNKPDYWPKPSPFTWLHDCIVSREEKGRLEHCVGCSFEQHLWMILEAKVGQDPVWRFRNIPCLINCVLEPVGSSGFELSLMSWRQHTTFMFGEHVWRDTSLSVQEGESAVAYSEMVVSWNKWTCRLLSDKLRITALKHSKL